MTRRRAAPRRFFALLASVVLAPLALSACGEEEGGGAQSYSDQQITDALALEEANGVLSVEGEIFCEVRPDFLNDADEVDEALDRRAGLVLTSRQGNVGVQVVPPFARDCERRVERELKQLDPTPRLERREREERNGSGQDEGGSGDGEGSGGGEDSNGEDSNGDGENSGEDSGS